MSADVAHRRPLSTSPASQWLVLGFALLWPTLAAYAYFILFSGHQAMSLVYGGAKALQFSFPLVWILAVQKQRLKLQPPKGAGLAWGLAIGLGFVIAGLASYYGYFKQSGLLAQTPDLVTAKLRDWGMTTPGRYLAFAIFLATVHALLEEYYWRWFTFDQLRHLTPLPWAVAISSLGFMAHHVLIIHQFLAGNWTMTVFLSLCVACGGAVWAWLYHRYRSIYGPWISHFLVDCVIMYIGYDLVW